MGRSASPAAEVEAWRAALPGLAGAAGLAEGDLIDTVRALEELKAGCAAAQAELTARLRAGRMARDAAAGVPVAKRGAGLAAEVALARREAPAKGDRHLGFALAMAEMPYTMAALRAGVLSEWRATLLVRETATLSRADRARVDADLVGRQAPGATAAGEDVTTMGDRALAAAARARACRLDPGAALRRSRAAQRDRRVTLRPAPDTMTVLTGFLPVAQGVAAWAALDAHATRSKAAGDRRSRAQIMADTLVERVTGQSVAEAVPVEVQVVMTDGALLGGSAEGGEVAAVVRGYGPVPASYVRDLLRNGAAGEGSSEPESAGGTDIDRECAGGTDADGTNAEGQSPEDAASPSLAGRAGAWLRRLYTAPDSSTLVAMDSRRRAFDGALRRFLIARDQACRTPWCDAPIRHLDHVEPVSRGGSTTADNAQGLCEACNYAKELPGWRAQVEASPGADHRVRLTTPTGHSYDSVAPPVLSGMTAAGALVDDPSRTQPEPVVDPWTLAPWLEEEWLERVTPPDYPLAS